MLIPVASSGQNIAASGDPWAYYRTVTVDNTGGAAHTDWPVMVSLTSGNFAFANADTDGVDLQFRATDGTTVLDYWREAYDDATDTATLWVNVPSVPSNSTVDVRLYYGNGSAVDESDGSAVFSLLFEDFETPLATTWANTDAIGNVGRYDNPVISSSASTWKNTLFERAKVVYDAADSNSDRRYKMYFSGRNTTSYGSIGVAFSPDGLTWTEYGSNPIIDVGADGEEDPYALIVGGVIHLYTESNSSSTAQINHYTSSDGVTFAADEDNPVVAWGGADEWDEQKVGTPVVWHDGTTWWMVYDGRPVVGAQSIGVASSSDGSSWTKSANNPIVTTGSDVIGSEVALVDGTYYLHVEGVSTLFTVYSTTDAPATWDDTSFTSTGVQAIADDASFAENTGNSRLTFRNVAETGTIQADLVGSDVWRFTKYDPSGTSHLDAQLVSIDAWDGQLVLNPKTATSSASMVGYTSEGLGITSDVALRFRMSKVDANTDDLYARIGIGVGGIASAGSDQAYTWANGYGIIFGRAGETNTRIWETTASVESTKGSNFVGSANFTAPSTYELQYLADGTLNAVANGSLLRTATDTTGVATDKGVAITQGLASSLGAKSTWEFVLVRPFDGVDPACTVGSETST